MEKKEGRGQERERRGGGGREKKEGGRRKELSGQLSPSPAPPHLPEGEFFLLPLFSSFSPPPDLLSFCRVAGKCRIEKGRGRPPSNLFYQLADLLVVRVYAKINSRFT